MRAPPIQTAVVDDRAIMRQEWVLFFNLLSKDVSGWHPPSFADADAVNNTVYYSTTASKLAYKDSGGTIHALY